MFRLTSPKGTINPSRDTINLINSSSLYYYWTVVAPNFLTATQRREVDSVETYYYIQFCLLLTKHSFRLVYFSMGLGCLLFSFLLKDLLTLKIECSLSFSWTFSNNWITSSLLLSISDNNEITWPSSLSPTLPDLWTKVEASWGKSKFTTQLTLS